MSTTQQHKSTTGSSEYPFDLSVVIVNYKSSALLTPCLESILASGSRLDYEVIVVDNNSDDAGLVNVKQKFPDFRYLDLDVNRGFAAGNNAGIRVAQGRVIALLNPDTEIRTGAFDILVKAILSGERVGIVGPKIILPDGSLQNKIMPKEIPRIANLLPYRFYLNRIFPRGKMNSYFGADFDYEAVQEVEQVSGACLFIKTEVIDKIGLMDDGFFMYFEETDWCLRAAKAGYSILYVPEAEIVHHVGGSTSEKRNSVGIFCESEIRFFKKTYGSKKAVIMYAINLFSFIFRILMVPFSLLARKRNANARANLWALLYHLNLKHLAKALGN